MTPLNRSADSPDTRGAERAAADAVTVLLTDDDADFRETERIWLAGDEQWLTREAADGEEALTKLDASIDILVLDQGMPKLTGPEVLARLDETSFDGPVVIVSAEDPTDSLTERPDAVSLQKPINRQAFVSTLDAQTS